MNIVGIDIGGTEIKYGLISQGGEILEIHHISTEASLGVEALLGKISKIVESYKAYGIAVSSTGEIDGIKGKVIGGNPLIPGFIGTDLVDILESKYKIPALLENDVNCAAMGEAWQGSAQNIDNFLCLTIGTGIGGGIVLDGELYRGDTFVAAEFGHILLQKNGRICNCGKKGCYEAYASTNSLIKMVKEQTGMDMNGKEIFDKVHQKDKTFSNIVEIWCDYLTDGLSIFIKIFNPPLIILGGGVSKQGDFLLNMIKKSLDTKISTNYKKQLRIELAKTGNNAGILGATYLLLKKMNKL